ncbi:subclass B1 metallo-beta-lactamase [Kroppenstedtia pulmonis]|uniref:beta-lactamase n=1 Tax=Kroppenstedtia pulmonis TaxID=1380685 RepID=A0A7D4B1I5_9BACL|nr:subclass B1 metallo-beta-lactamase [Kroppenstedtia pulmonis]QKG83666.1 subclass B1 metallo-beta-lactamase [Kroppenstedtia pulmonis]
MKKLQKRTGIIVLSLTMMTAIILSGCQSPEQTVAAKEPDQVAPSIISNKDETVTLTKLNQNIWVHTEYGKFNGQTVPSNGLIVSTSKGLVLIDSSWDHKLTKELLRLIDKNFDQKIQLALITHAHEDRIGGIKTLLDRGIEVQSTPLTAKLAKKAGYPQPAPKLNDETEIRIGDTLLETYYPGEGHTQDNITVWFPQDRLLFGGCLIRSREYQDLGNVAEANLKEWPKSVQKVIDRYPRAERVVPGHGMWGDTSLLTHTLDLLKKNDTN